MFIKQKRSSATREAFLDAMERAMETKPIELIGIADLAALAGKSVGAFYTKFKDKDELLDAVLDRYEEERASEEDSSFLPGKWKGIGLRERVDAVAKISVGEFRKRRGLFLAYEHRANSRPIPPPLEERMKIRPLYDLVADLLSESRSEIRHADPERAARFAFFMLTSLCSRSILHGTDSHATTLAMSDDELAHRASAAMFAYLTTP